MMSVSIFCLYPGVTSHGIALITEVLIFSWNACAPNGKAIVMWWRDVTERVTCTHLVTHASFSPTTTMAPMLSSQMTVKRIHREIADVAKEDLGSITLVPTPDNLFVWKGSIPGPQGSPYEGGVFGVDVVLGNDYP